MSGALLEHDGAIVKNVHDCVRSFMVWCTMFAVRILFDQHPVTYLISVGFLQ